MKKHILLSLLILIPALYGAEPLVKRAEHSQTETDPIQTFCDQMPENMPDEIITAIVQRSLTVSDTKSFLLKEVGPRRSALWRHDDGKYIGSAVFNDAETHVLTTSQDSTARIWEVETGKCIQTLQCANLVNLARFDSSGTRVLTVSSGTLSIWDATTGNKLQEFIIEVIIQEIYRCPTNIWASIHTAVFNTDGTQVLLVSDDKTATIWYVETGTWVSTSPGDDRVTSAAYNKDETCMLTTSGPDAIIWDLQSGTRKHTFRHQLAIDYEGAIDSAVFNRDETKLLTTFSFALFVWDINTETCLHTLRHTSTITSALFNSTSTLIASGSQDFTAKVWDVETGSCLQSFGHNAWVKNVLFPKDKTQVITIAIHPRVWDLRTERCIKRLIHDDFNVINPNSRISKAVSSATLNRAGTHLLTSYLTTIQIWDLYFIEETIKNFGLYEVVLFRELLKVICFRKHVENLIEQDEEILPIDDAKQVTHPRDIVFDFNDEKYAYLRETYNGLPEHIRSKLDQFVINA